MFQSPPPLISVCLPVFNGSTFIEETIECILNQTYTNIEILISVDLGSDDSIEIIQKVKNNNISLFIQKNHLGWVKNCNYLIDRVRGSYFSIIPQDDLIPDNYFEKLIQVFYQNKNVVNSYPYIQCFGISSGSIHQSSITGKVEQRIHDTILNHFSAVSFRGLVQKNIPHSLRYLPVDQYGDMMADSIWILHHAVAGELHNTQVAYHKRYHDTSEHINWTTLPIEDKIKAWSHHCASMFNLASDYVSDQDHLYQSCRIRLLEKKHHLVNIRTNEYNDLLLKEFNAGINYGHRQQ